jgi:hypothetical protein
MQKKTTVWRPIAGKVFLFLGSFEETYVRPTCNSKPSMVGTLKAYSRKINAVFRKT